MSAGGPKWPPVRFLEILLKAQRGVPMTVLARRDDKESSRPPKHQVIKE
jgi:hypothetical protein